ncbi:MAG: glucose-6-phosphate dehydrogenase [Burkholderiales bacterium]|nr:glucose-6-phosphate dehydrogenase [Phycisphaerae bacterium]
MPTVSPCAMVIFGASGDLAKLKLIPAMYELAIEGLLSENFALVGYARTEMSDDAFRKICSESIAKSARTAKKMGVDEQKLAWLLDRIFYQTGNYDNSADFDKLKERLAAFDVSHKTEGNRLFYLSTPPSAFEPISTCLGEQGLVERVQSGAVRHEGAWQRVIIEKPFGHDLKSALELNQLLTQSFHETQIYRIDHYLGKETVQNLMVMRFANSIFEPIWNYKYIDSVQITVAEAVSADDRAGYYDKSGALRDMVQNHIFQLMALVAMEPPAALDARSIRDEKVKVYKSVRQLRSSRVDEFVVRGQYDAGEVKGKPTPGYLKAKGVEPGSTTETFVALKLYIDSWRWSGTPFYIRTGKCMPAKVSEVIVRFRSPPQTLFQKQCDSPVYPNDLVIKVAPEEGISMHLNGKVPGGTMNIKSVEMNFNYATTFGKEAPEAYERLIFDAISGDQTLFIRGDEAEAAWEVIDVILEGWKQSTRKPELYAPGTWGPKKAMDLIERDGRRWAGLGSDGEPIIACSI